jgi:hypothetical protein
MDRRFKKYNFPTGENSRFRYRDLEIQYNIRFETAQTLTLTYIILTFTSFSISQLEKTAFYLHVWPSDARMRHRQKAYGSYISEILFPGWTKFKSLLQGPWNSIQHQVRNRIILTFTSVFFDYALEINCFVSSWTVFWYTSKASTENIW